MIDNLTVSDFTKVGDIGFQVGLNCRVVLTFVISNFKVAGYRCHGNHYERGDDPSFWIRIDDEKYYFSDATNIETIIKELNDLIKSQQGKQHVKHR